MIEVADGKDQAAGHGLHRFVQLDQLKAGTAGRQVARGLIEDAVESDGCAPIVPVSKQRNSRDENETMKRGETPAEWEQKPAKNRQKDKDARWTKKHGKSFFGYKNHVNVDKAHKLIRDYAVTDAAVHDSRVFETLLDKSNTSKEVFGDSAYQSAEAEEKLAARGFRSRICVRGARGRPLSAAAQAANRTKSRIRARIEHVFGAQEPRPAAGWCAPSGPSGRAPRLACRTSSTTSAGWRRSNGWPPPDGRSLTSATETSRPAGVAGSGPTGKAGFCPSAAYAALEIGINRGAL